LPRPDLGGNAKCQQLGGARVREIQLVDEAAIAAALEHPGTLPPLAVTANAP
jgi:hypothetical protein